MANNIKEKSIKMEGVSMTAIALPEGLQEVYERMAARATSPGRFLKLTKAGFAGEDDQILAKELTAIIQRSCDYWSRWIEGDGRLKLEKVPIEIYKDTVTASEEGFELGVDLTLEILKPAELTGEPWRMRLPSMSAKEYDRFVGSLMSKGLTPNHVVARILISVVQTKKGGPRPKTVFQPIDVVRPGSLIDVTPREIEPAVSSDPPGLGAQNHSAAVPTEWQ